MRRAVVRKEWADTQEYESCQQNDMNVDVDENKEEVSFVPSAVSSSAEPIFVRHAVPGEWVPVLRNCISDGGRRWSAAHDTPLQRLLEFEAMRKEGTSDTQQAMEDLGSLGKDRGAQCRLVDVRAVSKIRLGSATLPERCLQKSLEDAATALKLGKSWTRGVARHRGTGLAAGKEKCASAKA